MMRSRRSQKREPTIALINIVFLMLVFFMVAGTLAPPLGGDVTLVDTRNLDGTAPADSLVLQADGSLHHAGRPLPDLGAFLQNQPEEDLRTLRIVPDRAVPAARLLEITATLRGAGAETILIVTERGLQ
ncbi:biopolymer transporter ExbD [Thalassococcus sp. S3]|uniref:ExbD/TolR family protein n=1 Tax=Thalassococcus sp. S3 TaxID=2017482 RepID=UPI0010248C96|nr:biopolymer transporter ExbD [Thalassococcus sp. S3]QBF30452.1 biopolymer transporter ExbD [Thalassococcus sp. S3]